MAQWVHAFGLGARKPARIDAEAETKRLGGKGASLARMTRAGLSVPPGFTIETSVCARVLTSDGRFPPGLGGEIKQALRRLEKATGARLGGDKRPLLLAVRSGASASMPGMMDTVLNLGLNERTVKGLAVFTRDAAFAWDCYARFIEQYGAIVLGAPPESFDAPPDMGGEALARAHLKAVEAYCGRPFPQSPEEQLEGAIRAVFRSWLNPRARHYRALHGIAEEGGTAVTVQAMVFGNRDDRSATGVAYSRDPLSGEARLCGEYLKRAQGEEVVSGARTPLPLTGNGPLEGRGGSLERAMPAVFHALARAARKLEASFGSMQEIEFTVESGRLYLLQSRAAKPTPAAAVRVAVELAQSRATSRGEALLSIEPRTLESLLHPRLAPDERAELLARGLPAAPGAASGAIVFTAAAAMERAESGARAILVRPETSPEDIRGMHAAVGILTTRGGMTSHAAVVARGMGRPCVVGAGELTVDLATRKLVARGRTLPEGSEITLDGGAGEVFAGKVPTIEPSLTPELETLLGWADDARRLKVRANADAPDEIGLARRFGADGIGLARSERMAEDPSCLLALRRMILASGPEGRSEALRDLLPAQRAVFKRLLAAAAGWKVAIRLFDPPLHEFLPQDEETTAAFVAATGADAGFVAERLARLKETNPMLGHRGCRLGITYPEIYETQARALFEAALETSEETGIAVAPEIVAPLVATGRELELVRKTVDRAAAAVASERGRRPAYSVGAMIELPRAALCAGEIARVADFFAFGTNDLTQTVWGISRDDAASFMRDYERQGVFASDPFLALDRAGVGELMAMATERGRRAKPGLLIGISGEHGGDPDAIAFCRELGLDYVSCSPFRVPIARLSAAQAELRLKSATEGARPRAAPRRRKAPRRSKPRPAAGRARARPSRSG